jgi:hypothetical protein
MYRSIIKKVTKVFPSFQYVRGSRMKQKRIDLKNEKRTLKAASLMGGLSGPTVTVESSDGKITRIRPYHYDEGVAPSLIRSIPQG